MRAQIKEKVILVSIGLLALGGLVLAYWSTDLSKAWSLILSISHQHIFTYLVLIIVSLLLISFRWKIILDSAGVRLAPTRVLAYYLGGFAISHITFFASVGGEPVRALLLKAHNIKMDKAFSLVVIDRMIEATLDIVLTILVLVVMLLFVAVPTGFTMYTFGAAFFVLIVLAAIIAYNYSLYKGKLWLFSLAKAVTSSGSAKSRRAVAWIRAFEGHIQRYYRRNRRSFVQAVIVHVFVYLLKVAELYVIMLLLNMEPSIFAAAAMLAAMGLASAIPSPMGLGSLDAFISQTTINLGYGSASATAVAMMVRFRFLVMAIAGVILLLYLGITLEQIRNMANNNNKLRKPEENQVTS